MESRQSFEFNLDCVKLPKGLDTVLVNQDILFQGMKLKTLHLSGGDRSLRYGCPIFINKPDK